MVAGVGESLGFSAISTCLSGKKKSQSWMRTDMRRMTWLTSVMMTPTESLREPSRMGPNTIARLLQSILLAALCCTTNCRWLISTVSTLKLVRGSMLSRPNSIRRLSSWSSSCEAAPPNESHRTRTTAHTTAHTAHTYE